MNGGKQKTASRMTRLAAEKHSLAWADVPALFWFMRLLVLPPCLVV